MFEIFKRVVNNEVLIDFVSDAQLLTDRSNKPEPKNQPELVQNYQTPVIRAQSIFVLAKHWKPFDNTNKKQVKTEEEGFIKINQLVGFICQMLDTVSKSKSSTVDAQNQGTWLHLTSLYYLGTRFGGIMKESIKQNLKEIKKQFEKISKKIIIENEVRVI